jgi:hypothetical protein
LIPDNTNPDGFTTKELLLPVNVPVVLLALSVICPTSSYLTVTGAEALVSKVKLTEEPLLETAVELTVTKLPDWQETGLLQVYPIITGVVEPAVPRAQTAALAVEAWIDRKYNVPELTPET